MIWRRHVLRKWAWPILLGWAVSSSFAFAQVCLEASTSHVHDVVRTHGTTGPANGSGRTAPSDEDHCPDPVAQISGASSEGDFVDCHLTVASAITLPSASFLTHLIRPPRHRATRLPHPVPEYFAVHRLRI